MSTAGSPELNPRHFATLLLTIACLSAGAADLVEEPATLPIAEQATVTADWVLLRDILGEIPADAPAELLDARITPSPPPGCMRSVPVGLIRLRLRRAGADLSLWTMTGPAQVRVFREGGTATAESSPQDGLQPQETMVAETIRRGAELRLLVRCGALLIETTGRLMQDAAVGDVATLRVEATRAMVIGRIIDAKSAEVLL